MISTICRVSTNAYMSWIVGVDVRAGAAEPVVESSPVPGSRVTGDHGLLRQLYVLDSLSAADIGTKLGCSGATILRRLRQLGVDVRPTGPIPHSWAEVVGVDWNPEIAYALGLMATDGNLARRRGQLSLVSKDLDQIETLRRCLRLNARIFRVRSLTGFLYKVQWRDRGLYDWFLSVGLTPAKSRTLGPLTVPDKLYADFFRGCIDGDGCVLVCTDRYHATRARPTCTNACMCRSSPQAAPFSSGFGRTLRDSSESPAPFTTAPETPTPDLGPPLCQTGITAAARLDVLQSRCSLPRPQASQSRKVSFPVLTVPTGAPLDDPGSGSCTLSRR